MSGLARVGATVLPRQRRVWERRALMGEPPQGLIGPDDRLRCMWPHHALRRPPIAWHARDMTGPLGMTVRQHHDASHAA